MAKLPHEAFAIRINETEKSADALEAALETVQRTGRLCQGDVDVRDVRAAAAEAESALIQLELPRADRRGATFARVSGNSSSKSSKWVRPRPTTAVRLRRDGSGWLLVRVTRLGIWPGAMTVRDVMLTDEQRGAHPEPLAQASRWRALPTGVKRMPSAHPPLGL